MDVVRPYGERVYAEGRMLAESDEGVGLITFNQPQKRNAMSVDMWEGFGKILDAFADDPDIRVVVLTGAGNKAFVSGGDISQFEKEHGSRNAQAEYEKMTSAGRAKVAAFAKPVIARIRGYCLGGGLGIAMNADIRIAGVDSEFGITSARLGIAYGFDMVQKLVALVGPAHARMLLYSATRIDAREAQRIGLVNRVVPDEELSDVVVDLARTIADNAPLSVAAAKLAVTQAAATQAGATQAGAGSGREDEALQKAVAACFESEDAREGRTAFLEKRAPRFQGR